MLSNPVILTDCELEPSSRRLSPLAKSRAKSRELRRIPTVFQSPMPHQGILPTPCPSSLHPASYFDASCWIRGTQSSPRRHGVTENSLGFPIPRFPDLSASPR